MATIKAVLLKVSLETLPTMYPETGESPIDFDQQFVAFSKFTGMDTREDQNQPLVLFIFVLALLPTIQTQIRKKVTGWQGQPVTKFYD